MDDKVDKIIEKLVNYGKNGYVTSPKRPQLTPNEGRAAIIALIETIIGEDEYSGEFSFDKTPTDSLRNELRAELRQRNGGEES